MALQTEIHPFTPVLLLVISSTNRFFLLAKTFAISSVPSSPKPQFARCRFVKVSLPLMPYANIVAPCGPILLLSSNNLVRNLLFSNEVAKAGIETCVMRVDATVIILRVSMS